jgi:peptidoglycan/LPS O-acetylase OafA/YrhL
MVSSYFITTILLARPVAGRRAAATAFARNRALRLLPLYIAFVAVLTVVGPAPGRPVSIRGDLAYL